MVAERDSEMVHEPKVCPILTGSDSVGYYSPEDISEEEAAPLYQKIWSDERDLDSNSHTEGVGDSSRFPESQSVHEDIN